MNGLPGRPKQMAANAIDDGRKLVVDEKVTARMKVNFNRSRRARCPISERLSGYSAVFRATEDSDRNPQIAVLSDMPMMGGFQVCPYHREKDFENVWIFKDIRWCPTQILELVQEIAIRKVMYPVADDPRPG